MGRGAWRAAVPRVAKSRTQLKRLSTHAETFCRRGHVCVCVCVCVCVYVRERERENYFAEYLFSVAFFTVEFSKVIIKLVYNTIVVLNCY